MHISFDGQGTTIAFNTCGLIFGNQCFFLKLQHEGVAEGNTGETLAHLFIVVAHVLGHKKHHGQFCKKIPS